MVNIGLKRKLNMKNYHKYGLINPDRVYRACEYLIKNHPAYKDIKLKKYEDWVKTCPSLFEHTEQSDDEEDLKDSDDEEIIDETSKKSSKDKKEKKDQAANSSGKKASDSQTAQGEAVSNDFNSVTCLYLKEPALEMIVNHSDKNKKVKMKRKAEKMYNYAPGEKQCPTNWIREKNHDEVAFPEHSTALPLFRGVALGQEKLSHLTLASQHNPT